MRKIILFFVLGLVSVSLNSCLMGYAATEPRYVEYSRPAPPNSSYIWIDGDYSWNNRSRSYVQNNGYWERPRQNQTYRAGYWQQTPKGKSWTKGRWEKSNNGNNGKNVRKWKYDDRRNN